MSEWIKALVLQIACLPEDPHIPDGSPQSTQVFRAGRNFLRWTIIQWFTLHLVIFVSALAFIAALETITPRMPGWARTGTYAAEILGLLALAASWVFTWFQLKLNYELRWYIVTDRSLRVRSGILSVKELTMTFANIQEIRVTAGPLQVLLGLADVEVRTAGGGGPGPHGGSGGHVGRFQGVDSADAIRDLIVERLRVSRDSGLGEPVDAALSGPNATVQAAQSILAEARALRASLLKA